MATARLGPQLHRLAVDRRGLILLPLALIVEPALPTLTATNLAGLVWLGLIGSAATYALWFRGVARIEPGAVSMLGMMSPVTAVILGWVVLGESLSLLQGFGALIVLGSVWAGQRANRPTTQVPTKPEAGPDPADGTIMNRTGAFLAMFGADPFRYVMANRTEMKP